MHSNDHPMHGQPRLDFDVLHSVCNCLTKVSDVLSFALTCSTLRKSALQRYLMMSPVVLSDANSVDRFYSFIFADAAARAPFIYGLELARFCSDAKDGSRFQVSSDRLVAILEVAIHLEYLHLSTTIGDPVFTAAAKVTSIRELIVHADDSLSSREAVRKFLTTLRSPLQRLRIEDYGDRGVSASFLHQYLAHFASTLEILELDNFYLDLSPSALMTPFAATRSLKIESVCYFVPLSIPVEVLLRLFPNLDHTLELHLDPLDTRVLDENSPALRERSKEVQKSVTWPGFDHVICDAKTAFSMALQCPIRRMDIKCINTWMLPVKRDLMETLRHNSPRQLYFSFANSLSTLDGMFPLEAADKLTHLVMFANLHVSLPRTGHDDAIDIDIPWIIRLIDPMKHLRLTHLRIFLYHRVFHDLSGLTQRNANAILDEDFVNAGIPSEMDLQPAATRFFDTIPTLQYVFLTTSRCTYVREWPATIGYRRNNTWLSSKAWRAVDANEHSLPSDTMCGSCVELDREAAEAIMDREELHLLSEEEDMIRP